MSAVITTLVARGNDGDVEDGKKIEERFSSMRKICDPAPGYKKISEKDSVLVDELLGEMGKTDNQGVANQPGDELGSIFVEALVSAFRFTTKCSQRGRPRQANSQNMEDVERYMKEVKNPIVLFFGSRSSPPPS